MYVFHRGPLLASQCFKLPAPTPQYTGAINDDFESYTSGVFVLGLNGGTGWLIPYIDKQASYGVINIDNYENYQIDINLSGLNSGIGWLGAYFDKGGIVQMVSFDDFESYSNSVNISGLNGGTGWLGAYFDK